MGLIRFTKDKVDLAMSVADPSVRLVGTIPPDRIMNFDPNFVFRNHRSSLKMGSIVSFLPLRSSKLTIKS